MLPNMIIPFINHFKILSLKSNLLHTLIIYFTNYYIILINSIIDNLLLT